MITFEGVTHRYRRSDPPALDGVTLQVRPGERVALLGPSGAGKSSLLRCINGLVQPAWGKVTCFGTRVNAASAHELQTVRMGIAMIFQEFNLIEPYTVLANALMGCLGRRPLWRTALGLFPGAEVQRAQAALARVGLESYAGVAARELSGGQRQRVAIARALVQKSQVLLGDEPVSNLDPAAARSVLDLLLALNREDGLTLVLSLHDPALALTYCDRIVALMAGRVVYDGPAVDLRPQPLSAIYGMDSKPLVTALPLRSPVVK